MLGIDVNEGYATALAQAAAVRIRMAGSQLRKVLEMKSTRMPGAAIEKAESVIDRFDRLANMILEGKADVQDERLLVESPLKAVRTLTALFYSHEREYGVPYSDRWYPSMIDYTPGAKILIVGEAPAYAEIACGRPLADLITIVSGRCGSCEMLKSCYRHLLASASARPGLGPRCEPKPSDRARRENLQLVNQTSVRNAGTLLYELMRNAGLVRASWSEVTGVGGIPCAISNVHRLVIDKSNGNTDPKITEDLLLMLRAEALILNPLVTVALGRVAVAAITGKNKPSWLSDTIANVAPFGFVLQTYHPAAVLHSHGDETRALRMKQHMQSVMHKAAAIVRHGKPYTTPVDVLEVDTCDFEAEMAQSQIQLL